MKLPTVTEIIKSAGLINFDHVPEETLNLKMRLGAEVHRICSDAGAIALNDSKSPAWDYARSFRRWLDQTNAVVLRSEFEIKGSVNGMKYIGHPDLEIKWHGEKWLLDLKTGEVQPWHAIQTAAYCYGELRNRASKRGILQLWPTGASLVPRSNAFDFEAWEACVTLFYWGQQCLKHKPPSR